MDRLTSIILIAILLSGCPAAFYGNLKNESSSDVFVIPPFKTENKLLVESGSIREVNWHQECITIMDGENVKYYAGWPIPSNVVSNHTLSSSLNAIYRNDELFFQSKDGKFIKIEETENCDKP